MSNSGLIIGLVFLAVIVGGGYMFRKQIQAFIEKHTGGAGAGGGAEGPAYNPVDEEALSKMSDKDRQALGMGMALEDMQKSKLAYSRAEINSYT